MECLQQKKEKTGVWVMSDERRGEFDYYFFNNK